MLSMSVIISLFMFLVFLFLVFRIDHGVKKLENIENLLKGMNYKINLFAKKFDVVDNNIK